MGVASLQARRGEGLMARDPRQQVCMRLCYLHGKGNAGFLVEMVDQSLAKGGGRRPDPAW
jgi:hypothetical protein